MWRHPPTVPTVAGRRRALPLRSAHDVSRDRAFTLWFFKYINQGLYLVFFGDYCITLYKLVSSLIHSETETSRNITNLLLKSRAARGGCHTLLGPAPASTMSFFGRPGCTLAFLLVTRALVQEKRQSIDDVVHDMLVVVSAHWIRVSEEY